jgi:osmotically-inducible protein OsmY
MKKYHNQSMPIFRFSERVRSSLVPLVLSITLGVMPLVSLADTKGALSDAALTAEIKTRLMADDTTRGININVDSKDGTVTLRGTVPSEAARDKASEIAESVAGERTVTNALLVGDSSSNPQTLSAKAKQAGERSEDVMSDSWITTQVKTKLLADETIKGLDVNVSTKNGEVVLAGLMPDEATRDKAVLLAGQVKGVTSVNAEALKVR